MYEKTPIKGKIVGRMNQGNPTGAGLHLISKSNAFSRLLFFNLQTNAKSKPIHIGHNLDFLLSFSKYTRKEVQLVTPCYHFPLELKHEEISRGLVEEEREVFLVMFSTKPLSSFPPEIRNSFPLSCQNISKQAQLAYIKFICQNVRTS
ncbi:Hypothetical predicted protein [Octopus vulgaris]|uniref:Uncharacterized protein n=1 Tax=Octopus vulgaris TaxID=6645 RepID=A0AA36AMP8_OCTVU|nr:Hypothetical predicted protein [Octopus vulgaris]